MTGIPLVDAGMRELNETGFMHNRVRMIVATFLIYNLGLNWVEGERYFSQKLVDIDRANNLGNWKWVAGIETYSNDYYKAMSMESQMDRFDPDAEYVKQWVPELQDVPAKDLIKWEQKYEEYDVDYPDPIVNTKESRKEMIEKMKKAIKS
jgi:deoxyribodipyrimidine photo-lyase